MRSRGQRDRLAVAALVVVGVLILAPKALRAQQEGAAGTEADPTAEGDVAAQEVASGEEGAAGEQESPELGAEDIDEILRGEEAIFGGEEGYSYDPAGRRDPFKSLLSVRERPAIRGPRPEGAPGLLIDEIELIGIMRTPAGWVAQVQAADKQKSYLLEEGDQLYDGEVLTIARNEVVFKQMVQDPTALKPFRERVKALNP